MYVFLDTLFCKPSHSLQVCLRFLVLNGYYEWGFFDIKLSEFS